MGIVRTLLALSVVFSHTPHPYIFVGSRNAVQMFYMISGFLISYVLLNTPAYRKPTVFWSNRALRLYPAYYAVAALTLVGLALFNPAYWKTFFSLSGLTQAFVAIVNVTLIGQDWTLFADVHDGSLFFTGTAPAGDTVSLQQMLVVATAWTLGLELSFYLLAPFMVRRTVVLLSLFAMSIAARLIAIAYGFGLEDPWTYRFFPFELALFIAGMLSQQFLLQPTISLVGKSGNARMPAFVVAGFVVICTLYFAIPLPDPVKTVGLMALLFISLPFLFIFQLKSACDKWIGDHSYPLYIGHLLVLLTLAYLVKKYEFVPPLSLARSLLAVAGAVAFAAFLKIAVADPIENRRRRIKRGL
jgi:peptidoglycan/LPS O-acetylase OafA/YrhL